MFSGDDLSNKKAKQRQEANRAARQRLLAKKKKLQKQKEKQSAARVVSTAPSSPAITSSVQTPIEKGEVAKAVRNPVSNIDDVIDVAHPLGAPSSQPVSGKTSSGKMTVQNALVQRKVRLHQKHLDESAILIQKRQRGNVCRRRTFADQTKLFDKRISDVKTLEMILRKNGKGSASLKKSELDNDFAYIPPPATVSIMAMQIAFLFGLKDAESEDHFWVQFEHLLRYMILPGLFTEDTNMNPILPWLSHGNGIRLLFHLILMSLKYFLRTLKFSEIEEWHVKSSGTVKRFLQVILVKGSASNGEEVLTKCREICGLGFVPNTAKIPSSLNIDFVEFCSDILNLVGGKIVPAHAREKGKQCITEKSRNISSLLFGVLCDAASLSDDKTYVRMWQHLLCIPLLTWKVPDSSLQWFVAPRDGEHSSAFSKGVALFLKLNQRNLDEGRLDLCIPYVKLTKVPIPSTVAFLSNLVQLCMICPYVNPSLPSNYFEVEDAVLFFRLIAFVLDAVPIGTFSDRSAVVWVEESSSSHIPIIVPPVIIDRCKGIYNDKFVRSLFNTAIDIDILNTENVLNKKNEEDRKLEKKMKENSTLSTASLAAAEARKDKSFWKKTSSWAKDLSRSVTSFLSKDNDAKQTTTQNFKSKEHLIDASEVSRQLAMGRLQVDHKDKTYVGNKVRNLYTISLLVALCRSYGIILARWGGGGTFDYIVTCKSTDENRNKSGIRATNQVQTCAQSLLNTIAFSTHIIRSIWGIIQSDERVMHQIQNLYKGKINVEMIRNLSICCSRTSSYAADGISLLYLFSCSFAHTLLITDDAEIHDLEKPIPLHQVRRLIVLFKTVLHHVCCNEIPKCQRRDIEKFENSSYFGLSLIHSIVRVMQDLYNRSSRRPLCLPKLWIIDDLLTKEINSCETQSDYEALLTIPVLNVFPALVPLKRRMKLFERIVTTNRLSIQGSHATNNLRPGIRVQITRGRVMESGLRYVDKLGPLMIRERLAVTYVNEAGATEGGIDVGGLFKDFWVDLTNEAFNPGRALFCTTADNLLYPNPLSTTAHGPDNIIIYEFIGRILGKALYEGLTIQPIFAHFFLSFMKGDYNFLHMLADLSTIDPQLYNNLMFLKTYDGDTADMCLTFTVTVNDFGLSREVPLVHGGNSLEVTNSNRHEYIERVAKFYVYDRVKQQSEAFRKGFWDVIDRAWLKIFSEPELQVLISGVSEGRVDVEDWKSHTKYLGGYTSFDRNVSRFWNVVGTMSSQHHAMLLKFVTSCERPPPLGFSSLNPPFAIQRIGIRKDEDKLPTASTCFNILKLPTYSSERVLRDRLIYVIESGAGFELA